MPHNENSRVKIPALVHFTRLGYKYISLRKYEGVIDDDTNILVDVLCDAINRINATSLTTTDVQKIVNALKAMLENDDLGREFYSVLINGYNGLKLIDFEDFGGTVNSYHVVTEMTCKNGSDEFRPDITPLINGIPLAFIEVKKPNNKGGIKAEYDRMLMRVKNKKFRRFINLTQIMVFSNNSEYDDTEAVPLEGAFYSTISYEKLFFSHFREEDEKLLTSVPEKDEAVENFILTDNNLSSIKYSPEYVTNSSPVSPTNRIITSLFSFERILTFLKYAIAYVERTDENGITHLEKHLMRYPQFFAMVRVLEDELSAEKGAAKFNRKDYAARIAELKKYITERASDISKRMNTEMVDDSSEIALEIDSVFEKWEQLAENFDEEHFYYGEKFLIKEPDDGEGRLMKPFNTSRNDPAFDTMTSMRNVDSTVAGNVLIWEEV